MDVEKTYFITPAQHAEIIALIENPKLYIETTITASWVHPEFKSVAEKFYVLAMTHLLATQYNKDVTVVVNGDNIIEAGYYAKSFWELLDTINRKTNKASPKSTSFKIGDRFVHFSSEKNAGRHLSPLNGSVIIAIGLNREIKEENMRGIMECIGGGGCKIIYLKDKEENKHK